MDIATEGPVEKKTCLVVDVDDQVLHVGGLAKCHVRPMTLHRAFSLFVFDEENRLLLQQRAKTKYTFPLAWTNTVCSHPRNEEKTMAEWIDLRVQDELGWAIKDVQNRLETVGKLTYWAISDAKYGEKEIDTLYVVRIKESEKENLVPNPNEVEAVEWASPDRLREILDDDRLLVTPWFRAIVEGFGHPFAESLQAPPQDKDAERPATEQPEDAASGGDRRGPTQFVHPETGAVLPWFQAGNCSMPRANERSDHLLQAPFSYLASNAGKLLRSQLVKLYGDVDKDLSAEDVSGLCGIVERVHTASLLHDDIEDKSSSRRGAVCAHLIWGTAQTINTGTFNFLRAIQSVDEVLAHRDEAVRSKVMRALLSTEIELHRGQNADICWGEHALCPTVQEYIEMIDHKTGALFQACATLGAACSGNAELGAQMSEQFLELGRFFQVRDDLCNICDAKYWKAKGFYEDADEGKYSYPVLCFFEKTDDEEGQDWLRERLAERENPMTLEDKVRAYGLLYAANALHETRDYCLSKLALLRGSPLLAGERAARILDLLYLVEVPTPAEVEAAVMST